MILIRPAADPTTETDPRLSPDWSGAKVLLIGTATPEQYREAILTAAAHCLPLVIPCLTRDELGSVVIQIARLAPEVGRDAVVVTDGWEPCSVRAIFTPLTLRQRLRHPTLPRRPRPGRIRCHRYHPTRKGATAMTAQPDTDPAAKESPQPVAELVLLDPRTLAAHPRNIRDDLGDLEGLTASIAAVGVIEALTVVPLADGGHRIVAGHRRCAAAILADQATVPCLLRPDLAADDDDNAGHVARMIGENVHRQSLTPVQEAKAYQSMLDLGIKATEIARQTGQPRTRVIKGLGVSRAGAEFTDALPTNLTLDQAAVVASYADDADTADRLIAAAEQSDGAFAHAVSRARRDRADRRKVQAAAKELTDAGITVIFDYFDTPARFLDQLTQDGKPLDPEAHQSCPGHAAYMAMSWNDTISKAWVCTDPIGNGHTDRFAGRGTASTQPDESPGKTMTEQQKADRKALIESNKAMRAATETRRAWLRDFLARRSTPNGALRYATEVLTEPDHRGLISRWFNGMPNQAETEAREALGVTTGPPTSDARLPLAILAQVAGAIESGILARSWRYPGRADAGWLSFLQSQGHELAEIEQQIIDAAAGPDVPDETVPSGPASRPKHPLLRFGRPGPTRRGYASVARTHYDEAMRLSTRHAATNDDTRTTTPSS